MGDEFESLKEAFLLQDYLKEAISCFLERDKAGVYYRMNQDI